MADFFIQNNLGQDICVSFNGENGTRGCLFAQHGLSSNKEHNVIKVASNVFADNGYVAISFDSRYSFGQSYGELEGARLSSFYDDLKCVISWAKEQGYVKDNKISLLGHSMGGGSSVLYAYDNPSDVENLVLVSPLVSGLMWEKAASINMGEYFKKWKEEGKIFYKAYGREGYISYNVIEESKNYNALEMAPHLKANCMIIGAAEDAILPAKQCKILYDALDCKKDIKILEKCGHLYNRENNANDLAKILADFLKVN